MLRLGDACNRAGHADAALDAFSRAAELGRSLGDPGACARAAIGFEQSSWRPAIHDAESVELLEEADAALEQDDSGLRARVLSGLARARLPRRVESRGARTRRGDRDVSSSRRPEHARHDPPYVVLGAGSSTNEDVNRMLLEARHRTGARRRRDRGRGALWLAPSFVVLCDHDAARDATGQLFGIARRLSQPFLHHVAEHYAAAIALCDGDLAASELAATRSQVGEAAHGPGCLRDARDPDVRPAARQGRLAELAPVVRLLDAETREGAVRTGLAALLAELGMEDDAHRELRRILDTGLGSLRSSLWLASLVYLADASAALGDVEAATVLYELAAYSGGNVMIERLVACYGAMDTTSA
jgi:hypothetical protein